MDFTAWYWSWNTALHYRNGWSIGAKRTSCRGNGFSVASTGFVRLFKHFRGPSCKKLLKSRSFRAYQRFYTSWMEIAFEVLHNWISFDHGNYIFPENRWYFWRRIIPFCPYQVLLISTATNSVSFINRQVFKRNYNGEEQYVVAKDNRIFQLADTI